MFQACAVVNVKTGGIFLRMTQIGESVQILCSACRALPALTSACSVVFLPFQFCHCSQCCSLVCATDLMTCHAWLKSKVIRTVSHTFAKLLTTWVLEKLSKEMYEEDDPHRPRSGWDLGLAPVVPPL